ncbi:MAG: helix-turn-helix domain-containing protein, partial [Pseudomonadota bacterium]
IVAATHRELKSQIQQGMFREDLYYRLNVVPLRLPPLRERLDDVVDLVRYFLRAAARDGLTEQDFAPDAIERMKLYHWPGNVRELENLVRRVAAIYGEENITRDIVEAVLSETDVQPSPIVQNEEALGLGEMVENYMARYFSEFGDQLPPPGLYDRVVREVEVPLISAALAATRGNQIKAAELLGLNRNTLRSRIRSLQIQVVKSPAL